MNRWLAFGGLFVVAAWAASMPSRAACVAADGGIGGTGIVAEGGIGGTGAIAAGGIGGTGTLAAGGIGGTGIVGAITGFASICVNGFEVHFDNGATVTVNGELADAKQLAVGQIIAVHAENSPRGLVTNSVAVLNALEGPVTDVLAEQGIVRVMGRTVRITADSSLDGLSGLHDLKQGNLVRVGGYRNAQGEILATRIQLTQSLRESSAIGPISSVSGGGFTLDGLPLTLMAGMPPAGGESLVRGSWNGKALIATEIRPDPWLHFVAHVERVVVDGLIVRTGPEHMKIGGIEVRIDKATEVSGGSHDALIDGRKVRITGRIEGGRQLRAEHVELGHISGTENGTQRQPTRKSGAMEAGANPDRSSMSNEMSGGVRADNINRMDRLEKPERMELPAGMEHIMIHQPQMQMPQMGRPGGR